MIEQVDACQNGYFLVCMPYTAEAMDEMFHRLMNTTIKSTLADRAGREPRSEKLIE